MRKRYAAVLAQALGAATMSAAVGVWWGPEKGAFLAGLALVVGGALAEVDR
jgi:hypothetical protein